MKLIDSLNWRYATKKFSNRKVSAELVDQIIEATNLSASSAGLQPYRLFVVENPALKLKLGEGSFNSQIAQSSHLFVFAAFEKITQEYIEKYINHIATERETPVESLADFKNALINGFLNRTDEANFNWAAKQAYIALGTALIAAADLQVDATPMEGFDADKFDELLNLHEQGLKSVVIMAIGYRDEASDYFAKVKKVRVAKADFATILP
ncbi:NAD(P)H-dependent oxidoreductase [Pedobacter sp.]|uniref:NAD(P)H-dependent oxidoreductase n=1 Tax=Pedobacter sp. TaxID=1411316 RepID=UPI003D7FB4C2